MDLITVIVPIYNVESYLSECIESLVEQTYNHLQIILVDDGSTDESYSLCRKFAVQYSEKIRCFSKKNGGAAAARNYGLKHALGKYILFVDADDYFDKNMIKAMYDDIVKYNADIAYCGFCFLYRDKVIDDKVCITEIECMDSKKALEYITLPNGLSVTPCKLCRKEMYEDILFPEGTTQEDYIVAYKQIEKANKVVWNPQPYYYYRMRKSSASHSIKTSIEEVRAVKYLVELFEKKYQELRLCGYAELCRHVIKLYAMYLYSKGYQNEKNILEKELRNLLNSKFYKLIRSPLDIKWKILLLVMKINFYIGKNLMIALYNDKQMRRTYENWWE